MQAIPVELQTVPEQVDKAQEMGAATEAEPVPAQVADQAMVLVVAMAMVQASTLIWGVAP